MSQKQQLPQKEVPPVIKGTLGNKPVTYLRGDFLGKGGFARCYEFIDSRDKVVYAGKVIPKNIIVKKSQRDKVFQELKIHSTLNHPRVVKLFGQFEDDENVYFVLEICSRRSLMELHKRRKAITEPEARYFISHIVEGCMYLHQQKVIHRDLKLGNVFLNKDLHAKIGDFGLATQVQFDDERKTTLCGTPNYIAPEMLLKLGHSYGVDVWAIGCILYTLLCGKPPFETESLKQTYARIQTNNYRLPRRIGVHASNLIKLLLAPQPENRPTVFTILQHAFFTEGYTPAMLPESCLVSAPRFNTEAVVGGLTNVDGGIPKMPLQQRHFTSPPVQDQASVLIQRRDKNDQVPLGDLMQQLAVLLEPFSHEIRTVEKLELQDTHPASAPIYFIAKWVDYTSKYGISYGLNDDSVGAIFNDNTKMLCNRTREHIQYIDAKNAESYHVSRECPQHLEKKMTLINFFTTYMNKHLLPASGPKSRECDSVARLPMLVNWFRTTTAIVLLMDDGTLQLNFTADHAKIIVGLGVESVTILNADRSNATYQMKSLLENGCTNDIRKRLKYAKQMIDRMIERHNANH